MNPTATGFDRDGMAKWYAQRHLNTDPGITSIFYLPDGAPEREIRFLEVNELIGEFAGPLEPIDFGVNTDGPDAHTLYVLDVTPAQWDRIRTGSLELPPGWTLDGSVHYPGKSR